MQSQHWRHHIRRPVVWLRQQEPVVLFAFLFVVTGTWAFTELADEVLEGTTQSFDVWVVQLLRNPQDLALPLGPRWLTEGGRDITALGSNAVITLIVAIVVGFLHLQRQHKTMWLVLLAVCSGAMLSQLLKLGFARPRPDFVPHAATMTQSFPSGHSLLSAVVYLSLGALLAQQEQRRQMKVYFLGVALCLTFLIGISRIYLGVHYPTDVLAGWTVGLVWAIMWWLIAWYMRR